MADELVIGTVVRVDEHPGARAPSLLLTVDLGTYGSVEAVLSTGAYDAGELEGTQVAASAKTTAPLFSVRTRTAGASSSSDPTRRSNLDRSFPRRRGT